jgi:DNA polymerase elongation subunit (family B)
MLETLYISMLKDMKILFLDLETSPNLAHVWSLWDQNIGINQLVKSTEVICFGARWNDSDKVIFKSSFHHGKKTMLKEMHRLLDEADVVIGWNSQSFDTKHMNREFLQAGMVPPSPFKDLDLMRVVKANFKMPSNKLDYVSQLLGVGSKVKHSGFDLWLDCMAGKKKAWAEMKEYQIQDVNLLLDLYEKLKPWIKNGPNVALHDGIEHGCRNCGSEKLQRRGVAKTTTGTYQRYQCQECGSWNRGTQRLTTTALRPA